MAGKQKRESISKKKRFEVFKRDNFTCQYCGRMSPDVILEVDHIVPVAEGGGNDLLNLVTSCRDCNRGKGKVRLSDNAEMKRQQKTLTELAEKREQMEMMMQWKSELLELEEKQVSHIADRVMDLSCCTLSDIGRRKMKSLVRRFSFNEVCEAVDISFDRYFREGDVDSVGYALDKVGGVCYNRRKNRDGDL